MHDEHDSTDDLSDAGRARGEAILAEAVALGAALAWRRRVRRRAGVVAVLGTLALSAIVAQRFAASRGAVAISPSPQPSPAVPNERASGVVRRTDHARQTSDATPRVVVAVISPDPTVVARYAARPIASRVELIGDDELLRSLADAGTPGGLATIGGKTTLMLDRPR